MALNAAVLIFATIRKSVGLKGFNRGMVVLQLCRQKFSHKRSL